MSFDPCACRCRTPETIPQHHAVVFESSAMSSSAVGLDPVDLSVPVLDTSLALCLVLMAAVVPLTLARQRRRSWCVLSLRRATTAAAAAPAARRGSVTRPRRSESRRRFSYQRALAFA